MGFSTTYDVKIRYSVDNRAGRAVGGLTNDTKALRTEVGKTGDAFTTLASTVAAAFSIRAGAKALVGFNSTVEDTKLQIAGMLALAKKTDLADQIRTADGLYARLQKRASTLPGTTQEYVNMAGKITRVVVDAGGSVKDLEDMTVNAVVAAKGLGENWEVAARDIEQGLMGRYNTTDPFLSKVLGSAGYKGEEGRDKWRALSEDKRLSEMRRALGQKQFEQMGKAQGATFSGVTSTLKDTFEQVLGKVGLPLFTAITAEVKRWNVYLDENGEKVEGIAKTIGEGLVAGFNAVKDAVGFLVDHADLLITIGKVWLGVKVAGMLGVGAAAGGGKVAALAAWGSRGGKVTDGFDANGGYQSSVSKAGAGGSKLGASGVIGNLGLLAGAALGGYELGKLLGFDELGRSLGESVARITGRYSEQEQALDKANRGLEALAENSRKSQKGATGLGAAEGNTNTWVGISETERQKAAAIRTYMDAKSNVGTLDDVASAGGYVTPNNQRLAGAAQQLKRLGIDESDASAMNASYYQNRSARYQAMDIQAQTTAPDLYKAGFDGLTEVQQRNLDVATAQLGVMTYVRNRIHEGLKIDPNEITKIMKESAEASGKKPTANKPNVNVTIQRIEVQSEDPDRFAFGLVESFRDAAKNPSSAFSTLREG